MPLLAHLVPRIASGGVEPAATQALAYLLRSKATAAAFASLLEPAGLDPFDPGAVGAEQHLPDDTRPDLTVRDRDGHLRLLVENKFWAGLTDAQPLAYLKAIPEFPRSAVLFIVPHQRTTVLWVELQHRLTDPWSLDREGATKTLTWGRVGTRTLALTSWRHVLERLEAAADERALLQDIAQLRELTDRMNTDVFLPLTESQLSDMDIPRRLINYADLIEEIVDLLAADRIADKKGLRPAHGYHSTGRYLRLAGRFGCWLGVDLQSWCTLGRSPIWSHHPTSRFGGFRGQLSKARVLFKELHLSEDDRSFRIPILLTTGADRARVITDAVHQLKDIAKTLDKGFPPKPKLAPQDRETP